MQKISDGTKKTMTDTLKLPREIVYGEAVLTMTGMHEVYVENYRGILECYSEKIVVQAKQMRIVFCGRGLEIAYYTSSDMKIVGTIMQIQCIHMEAVW